MRGHRSLALFAVAVVAVAPGSDHEGAAAASRYGDRPYEGTFTVLESPGRGPHLCDLVLSSLPPQCDGLPVAGWDWGSVDDEERSVGTTWGDWHVTGTYDGERLTVTAPPERPRRARRPPVDVSPACAAPETVGGAEWQGTSQDFGPFPIPDLVAAWVSHDPFVANVVVLPGSRQAATDRVRRHYAGPLCVVERDAPTEAELKVVQREIYDARARAVLGEVELSSSDSRRGVVVATVWVADPRAIAYARDRWGGLVELRGLLQ